MMIEPIKTDSVAAALRDFALKPETGFAPAQRELCELFAGLLGEQSHVDPCAAVLLWRQARNKSYDALMLRGIGTPIITNRIAAAMLTQFRVANIFPDAFCAEMEDQEAPFPYTRLSIFR